MNEETRNQFEAKLKDLKWTLEIREKSLKALKFEIDYISKLLEEK